MARIKFEIPELRVEQVPAASAPFMSSEGKKCDTATTSGKKRCPVQIVFRRGRAYLRLCATPQADGRLVLVKDPQDALRKAHRLCRTAWRGPGKGWNESVEKYSLGEFSGRGRRRRARRRSRR